MDASYQLQLHLLQHNRRLYDLLLPHWTTHGKTSVLHGVPIVHLPTVRAALRAVKPPYRTNYHGNPVQQTWNTVYRGPRRHPNTAMTLKADAHSFDIYCRSTH